jgi:hypothetical protein
MPILLFTVAPAAVGQLHDLLSCLARFDEDVSWEATPQNVRPCDVAVTFTDHKASPVEFESVKYRTRFFHP